MTYYPLLPANTKFVTEKLV